MNPTLVVDASLVVKWFVREADSDAAARLLDAHAGRAGREDLGGPDLLLVEACAVLGKRHRRGEVASTVPVRALGELRRFDLRLVRTKTLLDDALALSVAHRHPLYDCLYLALARRLRVPLATFDRRLRDLARLDGLAWEP